MLRKIYSPVLLVFLLFFFLTYNNSLAQNTYPEAPAGNQQFPPGFRSGRMRQVVPQGGGAPQGRWIPGHYESKDGENVWFPGHYESTAKDISSTPSTLSPQATPNQQGAAGPLRSKEGFERPFNQEQAGSTRRWIPGQVTTINGKQSWIRGHYSDQQGFVTGPPGTFDQSLTEQAVKEQAGKVKPQGWAVVIGISEYQHAAGKFPELRYAVKDAADFCNLLRSPMGGGFSPERIVFLKNERATLENIKYAFFEFLKQALEEDYVVIYFSGHGTPEKDNPDNLYLLAYDSHPDRIASTAFPMWDIDTAFTRHIKSRKIVMFADACHSAGITGDIATRDIDGKNMVNRYLLEVAKTRRGCMILTASEAGELSQESKKWGGGHGVFTYFLLNGLKGEADINENNIVTLGELTDFVCENVRRATKNTQHPHTAGILDREFPLSFLKR